MFDGRALANAILDASDELSITLSNMSVLKIIYFCHGWSLVGQANLECKSAFEAWDHGPVVPVVYHQLKKFGKNRVTGRCRTIDFETGDLVIAGYELSIQQKQQLTRFVEFYGAKEAFHLSQITHEAGGPWDIARHADTINPGLPIPNHAIAEAFSRRLERRRTQ
jgi:uncharacterized phage-associated protein